jgi:hypothetical protein
MIAELHFLTPLAALVALSAVLPLALLLLTEQRSRRLRAMLRLPGRGILGRLEVPAAVCAISGLLGVAAAQPVLRTDRPRFTRRDAQAFVALDISRSMLASASSTAPTRLDRAKEIADKLRTRLADTPFGVATFTDRSLPLLFPTGNPGVFTATVAKAIGIERPPPRGTAQTVTSFDALTPIPRTGYFAPGVRHRLLVIVTDAESEEFDVDGLRQSFATRPRIAVLLIRVGSAGEQVFGADGLPETAYFPPAVSGRVLTQFLAATHGRAFEEHDVGGAVRAARAALGTGPRARLGTVSSRRELAPYFVLAAVVPLGLVLLRRNL